jgi:Zn-dependent peptidase ImmA (M78 family)
VDKAYIDENSVEDQTRYVALILYDEQRMVLRGGGGPDQTRLSITHELVHAMLQSTARFNENNDEGLVSSLATCLLDTIRRNPRVVDFLQEK